MSYTMTLCHSCVMDCMMMANSETQMGTHNDAVSSSCAIDCKMMATLESRYIFALHILIYQWLEPLLILSGQLSSSTKSQRLQILIEISIQTFTKDRPNPYRTSKANQSAKERWTAVERLVQ